jgi:putative transposase
MGINCLAQAGRLSPEPATYPGYGFPAKVIHHAVWLYHLFGRSLRDIELILAERALVVIYKNIRRWCLRFSAEFAAGPRTRRPRPGGTSNMDEVCRSSDASRRFGR